MKAIISAFLTAVVIVVMACNYAPEPAKRVQGGTTVTSTYEYLDYGNGVLYFPSSGAEFGKQFAAWRSEHPKWIIIAVTADDNGAYGVTSGYFVIANPDL